MKIAKTEALDGTYYQVDFEYLRNIGFRENIVVNNAIDSFIVEEHHNDNSEDPNSTLEKAEKLGILSLRATITRKTEEVDKDLSDQEKRERKYPTVPVVIGANHLESLYHVLSGFTERTNTESFNPTNPTASAIRIVEGGIASRMAGVILGNLPNLKIKDSSKKKIGF